MKFFKGRGQSGQSLEEYALVLVLVAMVLLATLSQLGLELGTTFSNIIEKISGN